MSRTVKPFDSDPHIDAAAYWLVLQQSGSLDQQQQQRFKQWLAADKKNREAWHKAQRLSGMLRNVPSDISRSVLGLQQTSKRNFCKALAGLMVLPVGGWWLLRDSSTKPEYPQIATVKGEQRQVTLTDGTSVKLNTDSRVAIDYSQNRRNLIVLTGQVMVETAADPQQREFWVTTDHGRVMALGTRFTVSSSVAQTQVAVLEHAVRIHPERHHEYIEIAAGQAVVFTESSIGQPQANALTASAWSRGQIVADDQRLDAFVAELERYHRGMIRVEPAVARLKISGVYQLNDIDGIFNTIEQTLPIRVQRPRPGWIIVSAK